MTKSPQKTIAAIKKVYAQDTFIQGLNALPILLNAAAWSGFTMKKELGFGYTNFVFHFQNDFGEMVYINSDLEHIWRRFKAKTKADPHYLTKIKKLYDQNIKKNHELFRRLHKINFAKISNRQLMGLMHEGVAAQTNSGNVGHIIEGLGYGVEADLRQQLQKELKIRTQFNTLYSALSAPTKPSFVAAEQTKLFAISRLSKAKQVRALQSHANRYYWIHNSYAGAKHLTQAFFARQMKLIKLHQQKNKIISKKQLVKTYGLSAKTLQLARIADFATIWQDERKANLMQSIAHLDPILGQIERRIQLSKGSLGYVTIAEGLSLSFEECKKMKSELSKRRAGCYILMTQTGEQLVTDLEYKKLSSILRKTLQTKQTELHGMIANAGKVRGPVALCLGLKSLSRVRKGDILVTSMTRPEYMPALRKAIAIVTDEGGITSHAAIVARELGIPALIGTKIATKVLKDGDMVEVDANHGVVRRIFVDNSKKNRSKVTPKTKTLTNKRY